MFAEVYGPGHVLELITMLERALTNGLGDIATFSLSLASTLKHKIRLVSNGISELPWLRETLQSKACLEMSRSKTILMTAPLRLHLQRVPQVTAIRHESSQAEPSERRKRSSRYRKPQTRRMKTTKKRRASSMTLHSILLSC